jgi:hypothetical protein
MIVLLMPGGHTSTTALKDDTHGWSPQFHQSQQSFLGASSPPRRYNVAVPASGPKRQPDTRPTEHHHTPQIYTLEATGLLVIAALILILTLVRYWHHIAWSAR